MRALVIHKAKDLRIETTDCPEPAAGQIKIKVAVGGICGSDLHYYNNGGFGSVTLKQPMVPGHEFSGFVEQLGNGVEGFKVGQLIVISPSRPCGNCRFCDEGLRNQCLNMQFYGSAMPFPHIQGGFQEQLIVDASQCVDAGGLTAGEAALAEPFSVALHATRRAGDILGKKVLVTGCGPIGAMTVAAARQAGAAEIVVTDLMDNALDYALKVGADKVINMATNPDGLIPYTQDKGTFDVLYECTGSPQALATGITAMRPRGVIMQLGLGGDMSLPMMQITAKELDLRGSFRFHEEFPIAVQLMQSGRVDLKPLISHTYSMASAVEAFEMATDRKQAMKTQILFAESA
jgi:L-idonate 5-dehydrogenase